MSQYSPKRKTPCRECPFRKDSTRGYLGSDNPEHFLTQTLGDADMPCHMDIDYTQQDWLTAQEPTAAMCAGAQIFQKNYMKMPRPANVAETWRNVKESPDVFGTPEEFLIHHMFGMNDAPVETSHLWRAAMVNSANDWTDVALVVCISVDAEADERTIYVGFGKDGSIKHAAKDEDGTKGYGVAEWVTDWYHGRGEMDRRKLPLDAFEILWKAGAE